MRRPERPRFPMGAVFGAAVFATVVIGFFWVGTLVSVGAGLHPLATAGDRLAAATAPAGPAGAR